MQPTVLEQINNASKDTLVSLLGIEITQITPNSISGKMPVDERHVQPMRILHGGASIAFAETLGSIASNYLIDRDKFYCVGLEINANHVRPVPQGNWVYGTAKALHLGKSTHIWSIEIKNEEDKLTCVSRLTMAIIAKG